MILSKQGAGTIYTVIPDKYCKYLSTTILKHAVFFAKANKSSYGRLHNMTPHDAYSITFQICKTTLSDISHEKKE